MSTRHHTDEDDRLSQRRAMLAGLGGLAAGAMLTRTARAGDLDPSAGPVAPTMKALDIVEPRVPIGTDTTPGDAGSTFRITQPGSYYLTGNVTGESGKHGIVIAASNVTIDLMGFTLQGVPGALGGMPTEGNRDNLTVCNGAVVGWSEGGVDLRRGGIGIGEGSLIEQILASENAGYGIRPCFGSALRFCTALRNSGHGFVIAGATVVESCMARLNTTTGFSASFASTLSGCVADANGGDGISASSGCTVANCTSRANSGRGINADGRSVVTGCSARTNGLEGIMLSSGSAAIECSAGSNSSGGIRAGQRCTVRGNTCVSNGPSDSGAGILVTSTGNLIEGNNCCDNARGIHVTSSGNFITRNVCSENTVANWNIGAGNKCLVVLGVNGGLFLGDSGGVSPGSADPNANYTY